MPTLRPQRHANAKLICPLRHRIGDHAIQPHCRQRQRQHGKRAEQPRHQVLLLPLLLTCDPVFKILNMAVDLLVRIDLVYLCSDRMQQRERGTSDRTRICVHMCIDSV